MESQEKIRLKYCNKCINKKVDDRFGILCGLTNQKPHFKYTCKDFVKGKPKQNFTTTNTSTKPQERPIAKPKQVYTKPITAKTKSKSPFWIGGSIVLTVIIFIFKIGRTVSSLGNDNSSTPQYEHDYIRELQKAQERRNKIPTINYLSHNNSTAEFSRKMETDTVLVLNPKVTLRLPRRFQLTIYNADSELPIKATSRGYYFIYNKLKIDKNQDQLQQWKTLRNQLINNYPGSTLIIKKPLTVNTTTNDLDRINFEIKNNSNRNVIGTARIVDYKSERYFFQLVSDASNADHTITNKYLRYYVKVK